MFRYFWIATFLLHLDVPVPALAVEPEAGRWCSVGNVVKNPYRPAMPRPSRIPNSLSVQCDGYSVSGDLDDKSRVFKIAIELPRAPSASGPERAETVVLNFKGINAGLVADHIGGANPDLKSLVVHALKQLNPPITGRPEFRILSIEVEPNAKLRGPKGSLLSPVHAVEMPPSQVAESLHVEGRPLEAEMVCLYQMQKVPASIPVLHVPPVENGTNAGAVVTVERGTGINFDLIVLPDGIYAYPYQHVPGKESEHAIEVPIRGVKPNSFAYSHWLGRNAQSSVSFLVPPYESRRVPVVALDPTSLTSNPNSSEYQHLMGALMDSMRRYRSEFDRDPRYRSPINLTLFENALNACIGVPALQQTHRAELEDIRKYVLRNHRATVGSIPARGFAFR
ncbi:MAG: hypothetical protein AB7G93_09250 [Bdellovibrionales bacterium]